MPRMIDNVQDARAAADRLGWREAYDGYGGLPRAELDPTDLESFGEAAWWTGKLDEATEIREAAYAAYLSAGNPVEAARLALTLSWDHANRGAFALAQGWEANAERLLEREPESAAHAFLLLSRAIAAMFEEGDLRRAIELFGEAHELGRRFGERDIEVLALAGQGRAHTKLGEVETGLALMDEGSAAATAGELRPYSTGLVYCLTISACQDLGDYRRAAEWTEVANRWSDRLEVTGFPGACRIHRAEIMRLRGDLVGAEQQAVAACEELKAFQRIMTAGGYYEIGEIRRRLGDFAAAEEAYHQADELGRPPQPGLSLLRLSQGKVDAAVAAITRTVGETAEPLKRARMLPAQVEIALAGGDLQVARAAADELEQIVDAYKIGGRRAPAFDATLHLARGRIGLAEGDPEGASRCLRKAREEWQQVGAPYEVAQARLLLAIAFRRQGDEYAATEELEAALSTFERLGAALDVERTKELLGRLETRRTFVFTDIVDSTRLLETLGADKWKRLLARHDELLRDRIAGAGGEVIKHTGDGYFAAFDNPKAALEAAVDIQRALHAEIVAPDVRIGAHTGGAFHTGDGSDYGGQGVHVAARIGAAAGAGEILVSRETLDGVRVAFPLSEPRHERFAGVADELEVVSVDWR